MSEDEQDRFYYGWCNSVLWPLFHGFPEHCVFPPGGWSAYAEMNRRFAQAIAGVVRKGDFVWVHDYHLMLVARELRLLGIPNQVGFFLHTPFPPPRLLRELPRHRSLMRSLLDFGIVGFQTEQDRTHFEASVRQVCGTEGPPTGSTSRAGGVGARTRTGVFPVSVDYEEFSAGAGSEEVLDLVLELRRGLAGRALILGVDRLDYTKGIAERLRALDHALAYYPELRGRIVLKQLVVPSRESVDAYADTREEIEELVSRINLRWRHGDWVPVQYRFGRWTRTELLAHYRAADVALVTPLKDGMNLVAKEFCAANEGEGVLILGVGAGAADELGAGALLVDPRDPRSIAQAVRRACTMSVSEKRERMTRMREVVRTNSVQGWVEGFLEEAVPSPR